MVEAALPGGSAGAEEPGQEDSSSVDAEWTTAEDIDWDACNILVARQLDL